MFTDSNNEYPVNRVMEQVCNGSKFPFYLIKNIQKKQKLSTGEFILDTLFSH